MTGKQSFAATRQTLALAAMTFTVALSSWAANQETILHKFQPGGDGLTPQDAGVIADAQGNLYGATTYGGSGGVGAVYKLSHQQNGTWTETLLHSFLNTQADGWFPTGSLIFDGHGNLHGVTAQGGSTSDGVVYKLTPTANGPWRETILHTFNCQTAMDGCTPDSPLTFDQAGNLYGETQNGTCTQGGGTGCGLVFALSPSGGSWTETIVHRFGASLSAKGGSSPRYGMIWDNAGNLYGLSPFGGSGTWGVVWELSPVTSGQWKETILWQFGPSQQPS